MASQAPRQFVAPKGILALRIEVLDFTALPSWLDLGIATADTIGLMPFDDPSARHLSARLYFTSPQ